MASANTRSRGYCLTINNPEDNELAAHPQEVYAAWQLEIGEQGTPHHQVAVYMKTLVSFNAMKELYPTAHIERMKGTCRQAADYAMKEDTREEGPWERGVCPQQGKRTDIERCLDTIKDNLGTKRPFRAAVEDHPGAMVKFHKGMQFCARQLIEERTEIPEVHVLWGDTGTGKSRKAREECPDAWVWTPALGKWFDGYFGQEEAIFEEFRGQLPYAMMLSVLDRYTHTAEVKGDTVMFVAKKIYITSPMPPEMWYPRQNEKHDSVRQLLRRITSVTHVLGPDLGL